MNDLCVLEKMDYWDVIENVDHEPFVRNRYGSLRNVVREECDHDHCCTSSSTLHRTIKT